MSQHTGFSRDQTLLFGEVIDEYVGDDNPVRFIDVYVDSMNLIQIGLCYLEPLTRRLAFYDVHDHRCTALHEASFRQSLAAFQLPFVGNCCTLDTNIQGFTYRGLAPHQFTHVRGVPTACS